MGPKKNRTREEGGDTTPREAVKLNRGQHAKKGSNEENATRVRGRKP